MTEGRMWIFTGWQRRKKADLNIEPNQIALNATTRAQLARHVGRLQTLYRLRARYYDGERTYALEDIEREIARRQGAILAAGRHVPQTVGEALALAADLSARTEKPET